MRGKVHSFGNVKDQVGITPAYAGKSLWTKTNGTAGTDHPRLCGEKLSNAVSSLLALGSPPPMRGKGSESLRIPLESRITPAYAGKRGTGEGVALDDRDHPRLCGEKFLENCWI